MIPTKQTKFNEKGNCLEACIASILEIPIDSIPDNLGQCGDDGDWINKLNEWLSEKHGLVYVETNTPLEDIVNFFAQQPRGFYHTILGKTNRHKNIYHAVVGHCGNMVFDPSPSGGGLLPPRTHLRIGYFVKTFLDF